MTTFVDISVVIPVLNEVENISALTEQLMPVLENYGHSFEIIFVDDGSSDDSFDCIKKIHEYDSRVRGVRFSRHYGQTPALAAGFDAARGDVIVAMDGDLQFHAEDLPKLVDKLAEGYDLVNGWRDRSHDPSSRSLPSHIANRMIARMSGLELRDFGTTYKAYRRELLQNLKLYGELHRFIPVVASAYGARMSEVQVQWSPRRYGKSHYGLGRTWRVLIDMITVKFLIAYASKPMRLFGNWGVACMGLGFLSGLLVLFMKLPFLGGRAILDNPFLILGALFLLMGAQFIVSGLLAEILMRSYHEGGAVKPNYTVREVLDDNRRAQPEQQSIRLKRPAQSSTLAEGDGWRKSAVRR